jgi:hypothetical protein
VDQLGDLDPTAPTFDDHLTVRGVLSFWPGSEAHRL